ncbi:MAG: glycosyl transferase [Betaproteobacteria bacterium]|nr:MAG: glycosyl transferase [Betaproteobacteria bacterium]
MTAAVLGGVLAAAVIGYLIIWYTSARGAVSSCDLPESGPQKFHTRPTPRIGGIPVLVGLIGAAVLLRDELPSVFGLIAICLVCSIFAFAGGLAEDFTKQVRVRLRLLLTFASATLGFVFLDARIAQLDIPGIDWALQFTAVSFAFTLFAVGGFAHALNIVDGFNGLAGVVSLIFLAAIGYVAHTVGDMPLMWSCVLLAAAIAGFLIYNFPRGLIFLGDGGAYLLGFLIAEFAVLLVQRNSEVSPWFALTLFSYPVTEVVFSIYRKRILRGQSPGEPDGLHLHMLVHKRLVRRFPLDRDAKSRLTANSLTSPFLWILAALGAAAAALFWEHTSMLQLFALLFVGLYVWLYWRIVRFHTPRALVLRRRRLGRRHGPERTDFKASIH